MSSQEQSPGDGSAAGEKSKKYDRQLRLWGDHGQAALEAARVCLIHATATGTEILKNLILPGVGSFTILDEHKVSGEDTGNNFFLDKDSIGKSRAQVATDLLLELNEDVNGDYMEESVEDLIDNSSTFFTNFNIVIVTSLPERTLLKLAGLLWDNDIPLLVCSSYGLIGYIRLVLREHTVVESHPDSAHEDLRLDRPFSGLVHYCDSLQLDTMSKKDHMHTPWLVLIYKYLEQWKTQHGEAPRNYREKNQLKEHIRQGILKNEEGVPELEENFDEAIRNLNTSLVPTRVPSEVQVIFEDEACQTLNEESKPFWVLARGVKEFMLNEGQGALPLRGSIPDMTADSERYIQLQNIYKEQANQDIALVANYVDQLLQSIGREDLRSENRGHWSPPRKAQDGITEVDIRNFCKNCSFLRVIRGRSLADEYNPARAKIQDIVGHLEDTDDDELVHYVMLRAVARFQAEYNRYPGNYADTMEADIPKLKGCLVRLLQDLGIATPIKDDFVHEYCRWGASEMHSVAAYIGGVAAQEAIKVLTSQFVPVNNTFIYNAMKQSSCTALL